MGDLGSIPGHGNPLQYSCLRIPWTEEPGRLQSMGSPRVRHNWVTEDSTTQHLKNQWLYWDVIHIPHDSPTFEQLKVYTWMVFGMFTELCMHHHNDFRPPPPTLPPQRSHTPTSGQSLLPETPLPWQPLKDFLSHWFVFAGWLMQIGSHNPWCFLTDFSHLLYVLRVHSWCDMYPEFIPL